MLFLSTNRITALTPKLGLWLRLFLVTLWCHAVQLFSSASTLWTTKPFAVFLIAKKSNWQLKMLQMVLLFTGYPHWHHKVTKKRCCEEVLFCSLAVLDLRVGHTMDILSPFIPVLCHSDWLFHGESCPRLDVVHPGRAWPSSPSCTSKSFHLKGVQTCFFILSERRGSNDAKIATSRGNNIILHTFILCTGRHNKKAD